MEIITTRIPEVIILKPKVFEDDRGFFMEVWNSTRFREAGIDVEFVQDNHSKSKQGTLRGLHYQIQKPQGKLMKVISGRVYDVVVDMRKNSPTFGQWVGEFLSASNKKMLWVPPGFAHGFYVTSKYAEIYYKCTDIYAAEYERSLLWNDKDLAIIWPLVKDMEISISQKDTKGKTFAEADYY
ncbi:MAG: dTDP-4-dehydrorhamnose 3,5-epimerase [Gammaproteobacteria bacterium]|jgi:dTDP-4-dehydrorhamnose 3,5-epimerase